MSEERKAEIERAARNARMNDRLPSGRRDVRINPFRRSIVNMLKIVLPLIAASLVALVVL